MKLSLQKSYLVITIAVLSLTAYSFAFSQTQSPVPTQELSTSSPSQSPVPTSPLACPAINAPECDLNWQSPACQETVKKLEQKHPGCFTDWIVACPVMIAPECEADWKGIACQEIAKKLEKQYPRCFADWILAGPPRDLKLRGKVVDISSGAGLKDIKVQVSSVDVEHAAEDTLTLKDGTFVFPVFKGKWQVAAWSEDGKYVYLGNDIIVTVPQAAGEELVIKLHISFTTIGKILHVAGMSLPKANYYLTFSSEQGGTYNFELPAAAGDFKAEGIPEGKYSVELWNEDTSLILPDPINVEISSKTAPNNVFTLAPLEVKRASDKLRGRVFNIHNKIGIANVTVAAQTQVGRTVYVETKTDKDGNYELTVFPGAWVVWPDFGERKDIVQGGDALNVAVKAGLPTTADFPVIAADATVKGIISLDGVTPISKLSAYVEFYPPEDSNLPTIGAEVENGQFSLQLPASTYGVWLYLPSDSNYGLTTIQPLQQAVLKSGETQKTVLTVKERDAIIEGALKDSKGNIIKNVPVTVYAQTADITEETQIDPKTGRYELRVYSGVYRTWTVSYAVGETTRRFLSDQYASYALPIAANARVTQDIVVYEADASVSGKVYDAKGKLLADATIVYSNWDQDGNLFDSNAPWLEGWIVTDKDGSYGLLLPAGTYRISAHLEGLISPPEQTVKLLRESPVKVDFRFLPIEATISGLVRLQGKGVLGWVYGWSDGGASVESSTDGDGRFVFRLSHDVWHIGAAATIGNKYYVSDEITIDTKQEPTKNITFDLRLEQEYVLPPPISKTFNASALTVLTLDDGTKITIPASAIQKSGMLTVVASPNIFLPVEADARPIGLGYDLQARDEKNRNITKFSSDVYIAIPYTDVQLALFGLTDKDLIPSYWDEKAGTWLPVKNVSIDREHKLIVVATNHFTRFALVAAKTNLATVSEIPTVAVKQVPKEKLEKVVSQITEKPLPGEKRRIPTTQLFIGLIVVVLVAAAVKLMRKKTPVA